VMGAGAGPWAVMGDGEMAGVVVGLVVVSAAEVVAGVEASPLVSTKVEGRMGVGVGLGVGVGVGMGVGVGVGVDWESCEVLGTMEEGESEAWEACDSASVLGEEDLGGRIRAADES